MYEQHTMKKPPHLIHGEAVRVTYGSVLPFLDVRHKAVPRLGLHGFSRCYVLTVLTAHAHHREPTSRQLARL